LFNPSFLKNFAEDFDMRLPAKADDLGPDQYSFGKGCGTRDAIVALRVICDRS